MEEASDTGPTANRPSRSAGAIIGVVIALMSVVYALAMFRGLESHSGYHGSAYQALHPGSFSRDEYMRPGRPVMMSLYYVVVKAAGEIWLDDRFTILVFAGLAALSLIGLDRTARLLGAGSLAARLAILSIFLLEHRILTNHALLIDNYEFNPTTLSGPAIVWLLYAGLAGRPGLALVSAALAVGVSMKNGWLPVVMAGAALWPMWRPGRAKTAAAWAMAVAVAGGLAVYYLALRPADGTHVQLFDYMMAYMDDREANPFLDPLLPNLLFGGLCVAAMAAARRPADPARRLRAMLAVGLAAWLAGGAYLTWTPDWLKIPYLVPFDVARALWWPQYLAMLGLSVWLLARLDRAARMWPAIGAAAALYGLFLIHAQLRLKLVAMSGAVGLALAAWALWRAGRSLAPLTARLIRGSPAPRPSPLTPVRIVAASMTVGVLAMYAIGTLNHRRQALAFLARHGVIGDNGGAKWVGLDRYVRERLPADAMVLALFDADAYGRPLPLQCDGALRTRGGRSMVMGHRAAFYFDYPGLMRWEEQSRHAEALPEAWRGRDARGLSAHLAALGGPDYLIAPSAQSAWLSDRSLGYAVDARVGRHTIFRKAAPSSSAAGMLEAPAQEKGRDG